VTDPPNNSKGFDATTRSERNYALAALLGGSKGYRKNALLNGVVVTHWEKARSTETYQLIFLHG
jgi:hypothetical protein